MYMDLLIREVATTQEDHNYILAYDDDTIAQTAASEAALADIVNVWKATFNRYHLTLNLLKT